MYDPLWEESPMIQQMRKQYHMQGLQEGLLVVQRSLVNVVRAKYPHLAEFAQQQAGHYDQPDTLELLIQQMLAAPDANTARSLLESGEKQ